MTDQRGEMPDELDNLELETILRDYYTEAEAVAWMTWPHPQLGGEIPMKLWLEGRHEEVLRVARELRDCIYV